MRHLHLVYTDASLLEIHLPLRHDAELIVKDEHEGVWKELVLYRQLLKCTLAEMFYRSRTYYVYDHDNFFRRGHSLLRL